MIFIFLCALLLFTNSLRFRSCLELYINSDINNSNEFKCREFNASMFRQTMGFYGKTVSTNHLTSNEMVALS